MSALFICDDMAGHAGCHVNLSENSHHSTKLWHDKVNSTEVGQM
jgi:hypothetical protein